MRTKKVWQIFKAGLESFGAAAGAVAIICGILAVFMPVSLFVSIPVAFGVGMLFGSIGAYHEWRKMKEEDADQADISHQQEEIKKEQDEILDRTKELDKKMLALVAVEQEMVEHLQQRGYPQAYDPEQRLNVQDRIFINNSPTFFVFTPKIAQNEALPTSGNRCAKLVS